MRGVRPHVAGHLRALYLQPVEAARAREPRAARARPRLRDARDRRLRGRGPGGADRHVVARRPSSAAPARRRQAGCVKTGLPLGLEPETGAHEALGPLLPGDGFVLFTDGLYEARAGRGGAHGAESEHFGLTRIADIVGRLPGPTGRRRARPARGGRGVHRRGPDGRSLHRRVPLAGDASADRRSPAPGPARPAASGSRALRATQPPRLPRRTQAPREAYGGSREGAWKAPRGRSRTSRSGASPRASARASGCCSGAGR